MTEVKRKVGEDGYDDTMNTPKVKRPLFSRPRGGIFAKPLGGLADYTQNDNHDSKADSENGVIKLNSGTVVYDSTKN